MNKFKNLMSIKSYLHQILLDETLNINSDFIFVIVPVLSITILMFGLRALLLDINKIKLQKNS